MERISNNVYFEEYGKEVYEFTASAIPDIGKVERMARPPRNSKVTEIKKWGGDNLLPQRREALIMKNHLVANIIERRAEMLAGQGLVQYTEEYVDGEKKIKLQKLDPKLREWLDTMDCLDCIFMPAATDYYMHGGFFLEIIREREHPTKRRLGNIKSIRCIRAKYMRVCVKVNGEIRHFVYCADWKSQSGKSDDTGEFEKVEIIPAFETGENARLYAKSIVYIGNPTLHDGYYFHPPYWGGQDWIDVSSGIGEFHKYDLTNSYHIRYHITYPEGYFMDLEALAAAKKIGEEEVDKCYSDEDEAKRQFIKDFKENMGGIEKTGGLIHSQRVFNKHSKEYEEITIKVIENKPRGEDLIKLAGITTAAIVTANNIPPLLANVMQVGKATTSGNEHRNAYAYYIATATFIPRRRLLKTIEIAINERGLRSSDDVKFTFEDVILTKLDENKSGQTTQVDGK